MHYGHQKETAESNASASRYLSFALTRKDSRPSNGAVSIFVVLLRPTHDLPMSLEIGRGMLKPKTLLLPMIILTSKGSANLSKWIHTVLIIPLVPAAYKLLKRFLDGVWTREMFES